jgi:hypothetical protein
LICSNATFGNGSADLVPDRVLGIVRGSNEKLILDVDVVLAAANYSDVCICDRVLEG